MYIYEAFWPEIQYWIALTSEPQESPTVLVHTVKIHLSAEVPLPA